MNKPDQRGLLAVLADSRAALLAGNLAELARQSGSLERGVETAMPGTLDDARLIKQMAEENSLLLAAALKGVRAARQRLRDLSEQGRFSTYQSNGQRCQPGITSQTPSRRL